MIKISLHNSHQKFYRDGISFEDDRYLIQTGGVFTSVSTKDKDSLAKHIILSYETKGETFAKDLRGSFMLYVFDKSKELHLIYTNHSGDKRIFYYHQAETFVVSNSLKHLSSLLKENNISYSLDRDAAYFMLVYGYLYGNRTLISEVRLIQAGQYLKIANQQAEILTYHVLDNTPQVNITFQDSLEQLDVLFRQAITREFEKDREYGFKPLCSLSGGLDSRMTTWVGHEMGYTDMTNLTFAQSASLDRVIPEQIKEKLNHQWLFLALDDGQFMMELEEVIGISEGAISYLTMSHGKYAIDQVDFSEYGVLHTGMLGDVVVGSFCSSNDYGKPSYVNAISNQLLHKLPADEPNKYKNLELMRFQNRGFNCALSGNLSIQLYSEVTSPFMDKDFLDFCLSLPLEYRIHHKLYKQWILQKYPGASAFKWEKLGRKITEKTINIRGKNVSVSKLPDFVLKGIKFHMARGGNRHRGENKGMNPFQYWYNTNGAVKQYIEQYFRENIDLLGDKEIRQDCELIFSSGNIYEKAAVLSLLAAIKRYWS